MPTDHKFRYTDLESLENDPPRGKFKILVVGTFNAELEGNDALWYYGRPENEFWSMFPRLFNEKSLHPVDRDEPIEELSALWKSFCNKNGIFIVDIFKHIEVDLPDHRDKHLGKLKPHQFVPFDFETAFEYCTFSKLVFTWKGMEPRNTLTQIKQQYINFFSRGDSAIVHLFTPSNSNSKSRSFKLSEWRQEFG